MDTLSYKTKSGNKATAKKEWVLVDAEGAILGRLASKIAKILRGKNKPNFTPHADCGDNVIVINAEKIKLTGKKWSDRKHFRHTGFPGGQRIESPAQLMAKKPTKLVEKSIRGMLPKNTLGSEIFRNLHVFAGTEHNHEAQKPNKIDLNTIK